jgi:hypothetical protein
MRNDQYETSTCVPPCQAAIHRVGRFRPTRADMIAFVASARVLDGQISSVCSSHCGHPGCNPNEIDQSPLSPSWLG